MKRCPQCNRVETEDTLTFCRVDGTPLVRESGAVSEGAGTLRFSPDGADTTETRILPTGEGLGRPTAPPTMLDKQRADGGTRKLNKPESRRGILIAVAAVLAISLAATTYLYLSRGKSAAAKNSIAVLPFQNGSGDPTMEYLSDGITESLINSLSQLPGVKVMARSTMFRFKGEDSDPLAVGEQLGVDAVLTGKVVQVGDSLSVQADLVNVADGSQVWGGRYSRKAAEVLAVQEDIAREIVGKLRPKLSGEQQAQVTRRNTENAEAYQLYLKGRYHANKFSVEGWKKALDYYNQAIEKDPTYPLPYIGIAEYYQLNSNSTLAPTEAQPKAEAYARKALELDATLAGGHTALGAVKFYRDWKWVEAEREFLRAVELSPNSADAHYWYGYTLTMSGRFDAGLSEMRRAAELDPLNLTTNADLCWTLFFARRLDEAVNVCRRTLEIEPGYALAHAYLGLAYEYQRRHAEAIAELQKSRQLDEVPLTLGWLGHVYARAGETGEARRVIGELNEMTKHRFVSPYTFAIIYAGLGDRTQAFAYLDKAYDARADSMIYLNGDPLLDDLRSDPRFTDLMRKVGLPQ